MTALYWALAGKCETMYEKFSKASGEVLNLPA